MPAEVQFPLGPIPATGRGPPPTSGARPALPDRNNSGPWPPRGRGWGRTAPAARGPLPVLRADALRKAVIVTRRHLGVSTKRPQTRRREGAGLSAHDVIWPAPGPRASRAPPRATGPAPPREARALLTSLLPRAYLCLEPLPSLQTPPLTRSRPFPSAQHRGLWRDPLPVESQTRPSLIWFKLRPSLQAPPNIELPFNLSAWGFRGCIGEGNSNPLQYSCLENPMDGGAWWAAVHGVAKSWT